MLLSLALLAGAAGGTRDEPVQVRALAPDGPLYVGQVFEIRLEVELDPEFAAERLVPLFPQPLDLPVQLAVPFEAGSGCLRAIQSPDTGVPDAAGDAPGGAGPTLVLGERVLRATPPASSTRATVVLPFRAECSGTLELGPPVVRYAWSDRFREDLFAGRTPLERNEGDAVGNALRLEVLPLPEAGRPPGFTGAVGEFALELEVEPRDLTLGESLALTAILRAAPGTHPSAVEGIELPSPGHDGGGESGWEHFELLGRAESIAGSARRVRFDLRPRSTRASAVPPLRLAVFRPAGGPSGGGAYVELSTPPTTILVRPAEPPAPSAVPETADGARPEPALPWLPLGGLALLALTALAVLRGRSRRKPHPSPAARDALAALEGAEGEGRAFEALVAYVGARTGKSPTAVLGGTAERWLAEAGADPAAAKEAQALLEAFQAAGFGGSSPTRARERVAALVAALDVDVTD